MDWPAWLAVAVAALALLRNVLSDRARRRDNRANQEWREAQESELRATRRDWTEAFKRMADGLERRDVSQSGTAHAPTPADLHAQGVGGLIGDLHAMSPAQRDQMPARVELLDGGEVDADQPLHGVDLARSARLVQPEEYDSALWT